MSESLNIMSDDEYKEYLEKSKDWGTHRDHKEAVEQVSFQMKATGYFDTNKFIERLINPKPGYHLSNIPKGVYGEFSKIEEEVAEAKDAIVQDNRIMELLELSDILLAIRGYCEKRFGNVIGFEYLLKMADATKRAFDNGHRTKKASI